MELEITSCGDGAVFTVKAVPGSSRTSVAGILDGMLKVKLAAPPEKGKANRQLIEFLCGLLKVKKNQVSLVSGETSPVKQVKISGLSPDSIRRAAAEWCR